MRDAIGIFDSGIGGLTVLREILRELPDEHTIYLGDTARVPYGTRSPETVVRYSLQAARFLAEKQVKLLVVACHTSSAVGLPALREADRVFAGQPVAAVLQRALQDDRPGQVGRGGLPRAGERRP